MGKFILYFSPLFWLTSCNNTSTTQKTIAQVDTTAQKVAVEFLKQENRLNTEFDYNFYLNKNNFEQGINDTNSLILIRPTYAIFVFRRLDSTYKYSTPYPIVYQITSFEKKNGQWKKGISEIDTIEGFVIQRIPIAWKLEDINGDNVTDLLVKRSHDGREIKFLCFLDEPKKEKFFKVKDFEDISNPVFDSKSKLLHTEGSAHWFQILEDFKWERDTLKKIWSKESTYDPNLRLTTVIEKNLVNGTTRKRILSKELRRYADGTYY